MNPEATNGQQHILHWAKPALNRRNHDQQHGVAVTPGFGHIFTKSPGTPNAARIRNQIETSAASSIPPMLAATTK